MKNKLAITESANNSPGSIYLCQNPTALETIDLRHLPRDKRDAIRALCRPEARHNVRILFFFLLWAVAAYTALTSQLLVIQVLSSCAIVCSLIGCTVLLHEASHRLLCKRPGLNQWIGFLVGVPVFLSVSGFRTNHIAHHNRRSSGGQPDDIGANFRDSTLSVPFYYLSIILRAYGFLIYLPLIGLTKGSWTMRAKTLFEYLLITACCATVFWQVPTDVVLKIWIIPLLISAHFTELRAVAEHGLTTRGNVFTATRTVVSNRCLAFVMCNINYHLEHHLFPAIPWYNLPKVHRLLREEYRRAGCSVYSSYTRFFVDFARNTRKGIIPNARLIPAQARRVLGC